jgi:hypothetical protein
MTCHEGLEEGARSEMIDSPYQGAPLPHSY